MTATLGFGWLGRYACRRFTKVFGDIAQSRRFIRVFGDIAQAETLFIGFGRSAAAYAGHPAHRLARMANPGPALVSLPHLSTSIPI